MFIRGQMIFFTPSESDPGLRLTRVAVRRTGRDLQLVVDFIQQVLCLLSVALHVPFVGPLGIKYPLPGAPAQNPVRRPDLDAGRRRYSGPASGYGCRFRRSTGGGRKGTLPP